ncbi:serine/threonine protein kinase [Rhodopirellula sallentina]|uniref:Serine/threonine protein kinase with PASTA sensor(S) n=1 Tax=Rhodopirellula sallentina SM41 TaxID=1263870 RepID=M5TW18_9BACT|nr:serine/threonine-protein kinase [Rhodopirellula sallentina]EMI53407.1 serine/threonine protein kinase with PASTA sensor(s) [Rhodopirellula sallentina SM41]
MPAYRYQNGDSPLDGYTIQHALGRGGFGEVYFAISDAGREVALKAVQNYEDIELRGIGHCMNLKSQHLVSIFDVKQDAEGTAWVIMEYVAGANLREILDESPDGLGADQATYFLRELCRGLSYLHDAGVVHRDLKPHNIFFEEGVVKIGDYSLSKAITASHRSGHTATVGSVHYMAPEIGQGRYDKTVDIYALGVILYEMLTGVPPFEGESMGEVLMKHLSAEPDISRLPAPFDDIVPKAMRRDPNERYQNASELLRDLNQGEELQYTLPPSTLSMIGERAVQHRVVRAEASSPALTETLATPTAFRDTQQDDSLPFERPSHFDWSSIGLWWRPTYPTGLREETTGIALRFTIATVVCLLLVPFGCMGDRQSWFWGDILTLSVCCVLVSAALTGFFLAALPRTYGLVPAIVTRAIAVSPCLAVAAVFESLPPHLPFEDYVDCVVGAVFVTAILDFRSFLSIDRMPRVGVLRTVLAGTIAMVATAMFEGDIGHVLVVGALVFSSAITIQLLSPHREPEGDSVQREAIGHERDRGTLSRESVDILKSAPAMAESSKNKPMVKA